MTFLMKDCIINSRRDGINGLEIAMPEGAEVGLFSNYMQTNGTAIEVIYDYQEPSSEAPLVIVKQHKHRGRFIKCKICGKKFRRILRRK